MKTRTGYLVKRHRTYYACWTISGKKFMKTTGETDRRKAETRLAEIMRPFLVEDEVRTLESVKARIEGAKAELVTLDEKRNPPLLLSAAWTVYLDSPDRPDSGPVTLRHYESHLTRFSRWLTDHHADAKAMRDVTPAIAGDYAQALNKAGVTSSTFNQHIGLLRLLWRVLDAQARSTVNPWQKIGRKRIVHHSRRELTVEELQRVCQSATGEMRLLFALGIYTGLRMGDCATLRWGETDLKRGIIRRIPMKTARRKAVPVTIPLHSVLRGLLGGVATGKRGHDVLPETAALYRHDSGALSKRIQAHFQANGIQTNPERTTGREKAAVDVGFHSLRHTFVSLCREANAPLSVVEAIVGHSNPTMTRLYTHTSEAAAGAAVASLPALSFVEGAGVTRDVKPTLPAVDAVTIPAAKLRELAENLTAATMEETKQALWGLAG